MDNCMYCNYEYGHAAGCPGPDRENEKLAREFMLEVIIPMAIGLGCLGLLFWLIS